MTAHNNLFELVLDAVEFNKIKLPTQPEIALRIRDVAEDPNVSVAKLSEVISKDPGLTARIIRVANSPLMRGSASLDSINIAISRLGLNFVCNLAIGLAMEQIFQATHELVDKWIREIWDHSVQVAGISNVLAGHYTDIPADQATMLGLLHSLGALPILSYAEANQELLAEPEVLRALIEEHHPKLGKAILKAWSFPSAYIEIPEHYIDVKRDVPKIDLIDIVQLANVYAPSRFNAKYFSCPREEIKAFQRIGFDPNFDILSNATLNQKIQEAVSILS